MLFNRLLVKATAELLWSAWAVRSLPLDRVVEVWQGIEACQVKGGEACGIFNWSPLYISLRRSCEFALEKTNSVESLWISLVLLPFLSLSPWWGF